jgi:hypothetical protein
MFPGPPLPLRPDLPLWQLRSVASSQRNVGAWYSGSARWLRLYGRSTGWCSGLLVAADLGLLLRRCNRVVVRQGLHIVLLESEILIQWRALRVVTGIPYLPCPEWLQELFPGCEIDNTGFHVPTRNCPPEAVLAECLSQGIPVAETHIIYRAPAFDTPSLPVDAAPPAPLR